MTDLVFIPPACFHHSAGLGHVHLPGIFAAQHADDLAHVLHAGGATLLHRRLDRRLHLVVRHLLRQVTGDDRDLLLLLLHEIGAAALLVELDRFLALLDHLLQQAEHLGIAERLLALPARLDIGILERRIDHAQRGNRPLVLGLHRFRQGLVDVVAQHDASLANMNWVVPLHHNTKGGELIRWLLDRNRMTSLRIRQIGIESCRNQAQIRTPALMNDHAMATVHSRKSFGNEWLQRLDFAVE